MYEVSISSPNLSEENRAISLILAPQNQAP